ncbi:hypothetical protein PF002_g16876 [Phytophthora fragariae]|uniref:DM2 domain-containing protein n=3 Tax=Phytophthora fragariae TaxID=53985 RepID=A0A6A3YF36_9STRA|nr:hypothetical protein PF003_g8432 [Phytophthora fragariae]KAE8933026.1 hypothetical protein PF009_g16956 [Phytophthora fragariae]KAE8999398.1 hypothetical protein PF011_g14647 [Phytophthora fragariae]KAE9104313.1 hypothetical protein PF007_g14097 [Phytophthora fragariae]KAE9134060.1 hypothetical protein PF006_g14908 [Phytophthora fragariae]
MRPLGDESMRPQLDSPRSIKLKTKISTTAMVNKKLYKLSPSLSHLLGKSELTRPAAIKEFWAYVKEHELQDPKDGRRIHPNQEMKDVFSVDEIGFTQVMGLLSKHLEKKPEPAKQP